MNKRFLSGPDLTNQIVGILVKFREDYVALMAVIEAMFYLKCLWQINIEVYLALFGGKMEILKSNHKGTRGGYRISKKLVKISK